MTMIIRGNDSRIGGWSAHSNLETLPEQGWEGLASRVAVVGQSQPLGNLNTAPLSSEKASQIQLNALLADRCGYVV